MTRFEQAMDRFRATEEAAIQKYRRAPEDTDEARNECCRTITEACAVLDAELDALRCRLDVCSQEKLCPHLT